MRMPPRRRTERVESSTRPCMIYGDVVVFVPRHSLDDIGFVEFLTLREDGQLLNTQ